MPLAYRDELVAVLRAFSLGGRGDDARGRNLASLHALEEALELGLFDYRPTRDAAAWSMLLIDIVGDRLALSPTERLDVSMRGFLDHLDALALRHTARITEEALVDALARTMGLSRPLARPLLSQIRVAALLWLLGYRCDGRLAERHPQARHVRKLVRARVDAAWERQLAGAEAHGIDALDVLAALPITFGHAVQAVQVALRRADEDLAHVPFAVFYALATDARRGGRVWYPPARYVENGCYDRATFDATVGHVLDGSRSRRRRFGRSVALSDLGLSAMYPASIARLDAWLARHDLTPLHFPSGRDVLTVDWYAWATSHADEVAWRRRRLLAFVREAATRSPCTMPVGADAATSHAAYG